MNQFEFECEFDGALLVSGGIAESMHAAGADVCVPSHHDTIETSAGADRDVGSMG